MVVVLGGGWLGRMMSETFSTHDDPRPNALFFSPDGSSSVTFCSSVYYSGWGQERGLLWVRSAEVGCFELAVARFRAELKIDTAR